MRSLSYFALIVLLAGCSSYDEIAMTPSDFDAVPLAALSSGDSPLREVALATDAYLRSVGQDPTQYLMSRKPQSQSKTVLYELYHRDAFPISTVGNPGHGSRYVEFDPIRGKVIREWAMQ